MKKNNNTTNNKTIGSHEKSLMADVTNKVKQEVFV